MDEQKALETAYEFAAHLDLSFLHWNAGKRAEQAVIDERIAKRLPLMRKLATEVDPDLGNQFVRGNKGFRWNSVRSGTTAMIGILQDRELEREVLGPVGPRLSASQLHPWVWDAAVKLWDGGHYREAVTGAAEEVGRQLRLILKVKDGDLPDLVGKAFNLKDPYPGQLRLRFPGYEPGSQNYTSAQEGASLFGMGCMKAIRNIETHRGEQLDEQDALERLAALSVLARWIKSAEVISG